MAGSQNGMTIDQAIADYIDRKLNGDQAYAISNSPQFIGLRRLPGGEVVPILNPLAPPDWEIFPADDEECSFPAKEVIIVGESGSFREIRFGR